MSGNENTPEQDLADDIADSISANSGVVGDALDIASHSANVAGALGELDAINDAIDIVERGPGKHTAQGKQTLEALGEATDAKTAIEKTGLKAGGKARSVLDQAIKKSEVLGKYGRIATALGALTNAIDQVAQEIANDESDTVDVVAAGIIGLSQSVDNVAVAAAGGVAGTAVAGPGLGTALGGAAADAAYQASGADDYIDSQIERLQESVANGIRGTLQTGSILAGLGIFARSALNEFAGGADGGQAGEGSQGGATPLDQDRSPNLDARPDRTIEGINDAPAPPGANEFDTDNYYDPPAAQYRPDVEIDDLGPLPDRKPEVPNVPFPPKPELKPDIASGPPNDKDKDDLDNNGIKDHLDVDKYGDWSGWDNINDKFGNDPDPGDGEHQDGAWFPIAFDLDGDGVELVDLADSNARYDAVTDGYRYKTSWVGADDGFLAYDKQGDGEINERDEIAFVDYVEGAQTDLEGLAYFDSNGDGVLDANDAEFSSFGVWQDADGDGESDAGEFQSLAARGITSIDLSSDGVREERDDSVIFGTGSFSYSDGSTGTFADLALTLNPTKIVSTDDSEITFGDYLTDDQTRFYLDDVNRNIDLSTTDLNAVYTGAGNDSIRAGSTRAVQIVAGAGNDTLIGSVGDDVLRGGAGIDKISGGAGDDVLAVDEQDFLAGVDGGKGFDTAVVDTLADLNINMASHDLEMFVSGEGNDSISSTGKTAIQVLGRGGDDTLQGTAKGDVLLGNVGDDILIGGGGDDYLHGGAGADSLSGGAGQDLLAFDAADLAIGVHGGADLDIGLVTSDDAISIDIAAHGLEYIFSGGGNDSISTSAALAIVADGGGGNDTLRGTAYNDFLSGGLGADSLTAGDGDDTIMSGEGADFVSAGAGNDLLSLTTDDFAVGVDGGDGYDIAQVSGAGNLSINLTNLNLETFLSADGDDFLETGSDESLVIGGGAGNDTIVAGAGNDWLRGGEGADSISAGAGDDYLFIDSFDLAAGVDGGDGFDIVFLTGDYGVSLDLAAHNLERAIGSKGDDTIVSSSSEGIIAEGGKGQDSIRGSIADDVLFGNDGDDSLDGSDGTDWLNGGEGDDVIAGGAGDDSLVGEGGNDTYVFGRGSGLDTIYDGDFELGETYSNVVEQRVTYKYAVPSVSYSKSTRDTGGGGVGGDGGSERTIYRASVTYKNKTTVETDAEFGTIDRREFISINAGEDTLQFGTGITSDDLILKLDGMNLIVALKDTQSPNTPFEDLTDKVTILDWAQAHNRVETFSFDDGTSLDEQGIIDLLATEGNDSLAVEGGTAELRGAGGNDALRGSRGSETLVGGAGDDTLKGGGADDTYRFSRGHGADVVHDIGVKSEVNGTEKVEIYRDTGTFNYKMWYAQNISGWNISWAQKSRKGSYDARYYEIVDTYADVEVDGGARDVLQLGVGIHVHDLMLRQVGNDLIIGVGDRNDPALTFEQLTDKITVKDWFLDISRIEIFDFEDGFTLNLGAIIAEVGLDAAALENWLQTAITMTPEGGYVVQGTVGDERFTGAQFADTLDGGGGDDLLVGKAGNDSLVGGSGQDTLDAGAGNDTLVAGDGMDVLHGGDGEDRAVFSGPIANYTIELTAEGATVVDLTAPESDSTNLLTDIETVEFDDRLIDLTGATNNAPVAVDGFAQLPVDTTVTGKLKAWDLDGDDLTYSIQTNAASGTAVVQADGSFIYTYDPNTGFEGQDSFEFQVTDSEGNTDTGIVSIEVFSEVTGDNTAVGGDDVLVNTHTTGSQHFPAIATFSDGGYILVWRSTGQDGGAGGIYGQRYDAGGASLGSEFLINQAVTPDQFDPDVAVLSDDSFVVTWTSFDQNPSSHEVYARHYDNGGAALGGEFQVNTHTNSAQHSSSVTALANGGFVVTWTSWDQDGSGKGIFAQQFDSSGQTVGSEQQINEHTIVDQELSQVVGLADGGFVVVWQAGNTWKDIQARIYDTNGEPLSWESIHYGDDDDGDEPEVVVRSEFSVSPLGQDQQKRPSVAALANGDFVVVWHNRKGTGYSWDVYGQRYTASGEKVGERFRPNRTSSGDQTFAFVTGLSDGSFVIGWQSDGQDGSDQGVYLQVYDPDGRREGPEIRVNDFTSGYQGVVEVAALPDGDFIVTWASDGQDGDSDGVYSKTFTRKPHRNAFGFGSGDDAIVGTQHGDQLTGGGGDDFITGAGGADAIDGGHRSGSRVLCRFGGGGFGRPRSGNGIRR